MLLRRLAWWSSLLGALGVYACSETDSGGPRVHPSPTGGSAGDAGTAGTAGGAGSSGTAGVSGSSGSGGTAGEAGAPTVSVPWDWAGIVGTGQSLAVGQYGTPTKLKTQPFSNMKLSTGTLPWPIDPNDAALTMVPLIEPVGRLSTAYPSQWPTNIAGETPHSAMANQITTLVKDAAAQDYLTVHGEFGENGQCMTFLKKDAMPTTDNPNGGRAYEATTIEVQAVQRLAAAAGKTYGVGAIMITHGECDAGNGGYENDLVQLWSDYNTDLRAITGQSESIQMLVSQQNSVNDRASSTILQWRVGVDHPNDIVCIGPKYQYPYYTDGVHLVTDGYELLGEKYGQVYYERVVLGRNWQPLQPTSVERSGQVITVHFHIPVAPLAWEDTLETPHSSAAAWSAGKGFEVSGSSGPITISSVQISGDAVQITCAGSLPATGVTVSYALLANATQMATPFKGTSRWGQLRDSDPFVGSTTGKAQPNYAVAFTLPVP